MKAKFVAALCAALLIIIFVGPESILKAEAKGVSYVSIPRMDGLPSSPPGYKFHDWREVTQKYIDFVFDFSNTVTTNGLKQRAGWLANSPNCDIYFGESGNKVFAVPNYFGMKDTPDYDNKTGEGIAVIAAVLSASVLGYDMTNFAPPGTSQQKHDYVRQMVNYYEQKNSENVILNNGYSTTGGSWWYELFPSALFASLVGMYSGKEGYDDFYLNDIMLKMSRQWYGVVVAAGGPKADFTGKRCYSIKNQTFTTGGWSEPDAAAGMAYILYCAYMHFKDREGFEQDAADFLNGAKWCMDFLNRIDYNPFYEVLIYFAPYVAARMNVEHGTNYNIKKMITWTLDGSSAVRGGWGMVNESWNGYSTYGLMGSLTDCDGYSFAMNTFDAALGFVPMLKYAPTFAKSIGIWLLNVSFSARYYYPDYLPPQNQTCYEWAQQNGTGSFIGYEGLRKLNKKDSSKSPAGWGDPLDYNWGSKTDFGYGNNHVGFFSCIYPTNFERVLRTDLNALDFFGDNKYPSYLYYNPYKEAKHIEIDIPHGYKAFNSVKCDFVEVNGGKFLLDAESAAVISLLPEGGSLLFEDGRMYCDGAYISPYEEAVKVTPSNGGRWSPGKAETLLEFNLPGGISLDKTALYSGNEFLAENSSGVPVQKIALELAEGKGGVKCLKAVAYNGGQLVAVKHFDVFFIPEDAQPALSLSASEQAHELLLAEKSSWNGGKNADRKQADSYKAGISYAEGGIKIKSDGANWAMAGTPGINVDLTKEAFLFFDVLSVKGKWTLKIYFPDKDKWGYYLVGDNDNTGAMAFDIKAEIEKRYPSVTFPTVGRCYIWFIAASDSEFIIDNVRLFNLEGDGALRPISANPFLNSSPAPTGQLPRGCKGNMPTLYPAILAVILFVLMSIKNNKT